MLDTITTLFSYVRLDWSLLLLMFLIVSGLFFLGVWEDAQN